MNIHLRKKALSLRQIALFGMLGALTFGAKVAMSTLPNIEPVTLMVMLFAVVFGWKALYPIYLYVLMEIVMYGIQLWNINYLYIWLILAVVAIALRKMRNPLLWALVAGAFGMAFGLLCAPVYSVMGGWSYAYRWWLSGIAFDVPHAIGNFCIVLALFAPLRDLLEKLYSRIRE